MPRLDWLLLVATAALLVLGHACSCGRPPPSVTCSPAATPQAFLRRHLVNIAIGIVLAVLVAATEHRWLRILAPPVYVVSLIGLLLVLAMGSTINGAHSWIVLAGGLPGAAGRVRQGGAGGRHGDAAVGEVRDGEDGGPRATGGDVLLGSSPWPRCPSGLILLQPDFGTFVVFVAITFGVLLLARVRLLHIFVLVAVGVLAIVAALQLNIVKGYQLDRITAFVDPESADPRGTAYNVTQAQIAVGSGSCSARASSPARRPTAASCRRTRPTSSSPWWERRRASWEAW